MPPWTERGETEQMIRISQLKLRPSDGRPELEQAVRKALRLKKEETFTLEVLRQSIDARRKPYLYMVYTVAVSLSGETRERQILKQSRCRNAELWQMPEYRYSSASGRAPSDVRGVPSIAGGASSDAGDVSSIASGAPSGSAGAPSVAGTRPSCPPVIVGAGPAGLFCALLLARQGLRPVVIERGERAAKRQETVAAFWEDGVLDPESNVQFGEGGAGTFSDGKLNTGIKDPEGRIRFILQTFVDAGANPDILYSSHPHVGTDVLTQVVTRITDEICARGGEVHFRTRLESLKKTPRGTWELHCIRSGKAPEGSGPLVLESTRVVLAIGHSARDTFRMLQAGGFDLVPKAFAAGLRIQHPQGMIDRALYGEGFPSFLPPSPYKLTHRLPNGSGVYSFCMCPGGYVVNAASEQGMLAVNGMSYRDRGSGYANSALVVTISPEEIRAMGGWQDSEDPLIGMEFQRRLERAAYRAGDGAIPVQRFEDYRSGEGAQGSILYEPKIRGRWVSADVRHILPASVAAGIEEGILAWDRQIRGFADPEALLAGVESRTSSPVRITRDGSLQAADRPGIYPCGEGAGYAGGITSAAADGLRIAEAILSETRLC